MGGTRADNEETSRRTFFSERGGGGRGMEQTDISSSLEIMLMFLLLLFLLLLLLLPTQMIGWERGQCGRERKTLGRPLKISSPPATCGHKKEACLHTCRGMADDVTTTQDKAHHNNFFYSSFGVCFFAVCLSPLNPSG